MPARTTDPTPTATPPSRPSGPAGSGAPGARAQAFGRWGVRALPLYALLAGLTQRDGDAFSTDPTVYAHYRAYGRLAPWELVATYGLATLGVFAMLALAALTIRGRGRRVAVAGLVIGCVGTAILMLTLGSLIVRADRVRSDFFGGHWSRIAVNAGAHGALDGLVVAGGTVALTTGWILLGVAVWRTRGMNRADGPLIVLSAPMLYVGGMALRTMPTMGSFLLLAAGLGIAAQARRVVVAGEAPMPVTRSRTYGGADVPITPDDLDEFERDFGGADGAFVPGAPVNGVLVHGAAFDAFAGGVFARRPAPPRPSRRPSPRGTPVAWPVTRAHREDPTRPVGPPVRDVTGTPDRPKSGLKAALTAIFHSSTSVSRKAPGTTPAASERPRAAAPERSRAAAPEIAPPAVSTAPAGRMTTPSLANRVPGAPTSTAAKATNAAKPGRGPRSANTKPGKGKPGQS